MSDLFCSSNNSSSALDFSWFLLFDVKDHRYKCSIDGMEYLQLICFTDTF